jgi:hypothetical protein
MLLNFTEKSVLGSQSYSSALVNCKVCELVKLLILLVVTDL